METAIESHTLKTKRPPSTCVASSMCACGVGQAPVPGNVDKGTTSHPVSKTRFSRLCALSLQKAELQQSALICSFRLFWPLSLADLTLSTT
eukprot:6459817-Amphidinium_carterae.1